MSVSAAVGVVTQDPHLFHDTIAADLRYGWSVGDRCRARGRLPGRPHPQPHPSPPDGDDTVVGERGHRLSGGKNNAWRLPGSSSRIRPW